MAKITAPKAFDKQSLDPKILEQIDPFIEYVNQNFDQLIRALFNQITLTENFRGRLVTVSAWHRREVLIESQGQGILAALPLKSEPSGLKSYVTTSDTGGRLSFTPAFDAAIPIKTRSVSVSSPFATYEIQASQTVLCGDKVSISQYGSKGNNGDFVVLSRSDSAVTVYNPSAATETKASYSGVAESEKTVTLFLFSV